MLWASFAKHTWVTNSKCLLFPEGAHRSIRADIWWGCLHEWDSFLQVRWPHPICSCHLALFCLRGSRLPLPGSLQVSAGTAQWKYCAHVIMMVPTTGTVIRLLPREVWSLLTGWVGNVESWNQMAKCFANELEIKFTDHLAHSSLSVVPSKVCTEGFPKL